MINKLLPFLILFVPQKHFEIYYSVILFFFLIDFFKDFRINLKFLAIFLILSTIVLFRTTLYVSYDDFKELVKVSFFLIVSFTFSMVSSNTLIAFV